MPVTTHPSSAALLFAFAKKASAKLSDDTTRKGFVFALLLLAHKHARDGDALQAELDQVLANLDVFDSVPAVTETARELVRGAVRATAAADRAIRRAAARRWWLRDHAARDELGRARPSQRAPSEIAAAFVDELWLGRVVDQAELDWLGNAIACLDDELEKRGFDLKQGDGAELARNKHRVVSR